MDQSEKLIRQILRLVHHLRSYRCTTNEKKKKRKHKIFSFAAVYTELL